MEGTANGQVSAEEMLAELKRALESSTPAPDAPPRSASKAAKSGLPGAETRRSHWGIDPPVKANADGSAAQPAALQKSARPGSRREKLRAGGLALGGAAAFFAGVALMSQVLNRPAHEDSAAATEGLAGPQNERILKSPSDSRSLIEGGRQAPLQAGASGAAPDANLTPAIDGSTPAQGKAEGDAPHLASSGTETAPPAPAPLNSAPVWAPAVRIGPDGAPIATVPPAPASTVSAPPLAQAPKPAAPSAAPQMGRPDAASIAAPQPTRASSDSAPPPAEAPKPAVQTASPQTVKGDKASVVATPPTRPSSDSAPPAEAPKPNATRTASVSSESGEPATPKIDSRKKPPEKPSVQKPRRIAKASAKSGAPTERQSARPAPPKEAERSPEPPQGAGSPAPVAPVKAPSVQQRVADGMGHAFGYLVHLPGALVPHFGGSNPNPQ